MNQELNTPLQRIIGSLAAEADYDLLDFREQLIIDLLLDDWTQTDIGFVMGVSQGWVSICFHRIRFKMAKSYLRRTLEIRSHYKDISPLRSGGTEFEEDING